MVVLVPDHGCDAHDNCTISLYSATMSLVYKKFYPIRALYIGGGIKLRPSLSLTATRIILVLCLGYVILR